MSAVTARVCAISRSLSLVFALLFTTALHAALTTTFTQTAVEVSGTTLHGKVVLVGVALEPRGYYHRLNVFTDVIEDTDGDGKVDKNVDNNIFWKSIWGVNDLQSGEYAVGRPDRSPGREREPGAFEFSRTGPTLFTHLTETGSLLEFVWVRPTGDVFQAQMVDGGTDDHDGVEDGQIDVSIDDFVLVNGTGTKPDEFKPGDVIFVIDGDTLTIASRKVQ